MVIVTDTDTLQKVGAGGPSGRGGGQKALGCCCVNMFTNLLVAIKVARSSLSDLKMQLRV